MPNISNLLASQDGYSTAQGSWVTDTWNYAGNLNSGATDLRIAIHFELPQTILKSSTIDMSSLELYLNNPPLNSVTVLVALTANPAWPANAAEHQERALTTARTEYTYTSSATVGPRTLDLKAALQELVNAGPVSAVLVTILDKNGPANKNARAQYKSLENSTDKPTLNVSWTLPTVTGTGAASAPSQTASGSGSATNPQASGSGAASAPEGTPSGSGSQGQVTASGSGSASAPAEGASGSGYMTYPPSEGAGGGAAPEGQGSGSGSQGQVTAGGSGSATAPQESASGSGSASQVESAGAGSANAPQGAAAGSGQVNSGPVASGSGAIAAPGQVASGEGVTPTARDLFRPSQPKPKKHIRLLNRSREVLAILDISSPAVWSRKRNEATEITVSVPRGDIKLPYTQVASLIEVWEGDRRLIGGRISGRDVGAELVTLTAMSEEILLEQHLTPTNYSQVFANTDLADVVRRCLDSWHPLRVKAKDTWLQRRVASSNADLDTAPSLVMIQRVNGRYRNSASITLRFLKSEVPRFRDWERIRWASDFEDPVFTTIQYRYQTGGVWSAWLPNRTVTVGSTSGQGERGVMTDAYGLAITAGAADILEVRCNLYTDDTESGEEGESLGVTPIFYGLEVIARTHGHVAAGTIPLSAGVTVKSVEANNSTALAVVRAACEQCSWEFRIEGGKLNLAKAFGKNRTADFLLVG